MKLEESVGGLSSLIAIFLLLSTAAVIFRFVARHRQKNIFGLDDYMVIPAWLCFVGISIAAIYGMTQKLIAFPLPSDPQVAAGMMEPFYKIYWAANMLSIIGVGCIRLSALFFYRRVFLTPKRWEPFGIVTMAGVVIVIVWIIGFVVFQVLACGIHVEWLFDIVKDPSCKIVQSLEGFVYSSFILDVLVLALPIPKIWSLHLMTSRKVGVSLVFLLAATGTAASLARLVINVRQLGSSETAVGPDVFLLNTQLYYYLVLEAGLCLVAVNLPSLRYFFLDLTPDHVLQSVRSFLSLSDSPSRLSTSKNRYDSGRSGPMSSLSTVDTLVDRPTERDNWEKDGKRPC